MSDQEIVLAVVAAKRAVIGKWEQRMHDQGTAEDEIAVISGWDRSVTELVASIANRHFNSPRSWSTSNPRGCCTTCGFYDGENCPDMAAVLAVCAAWDAAMATDTIRIGLSDEWPEGVPEP